MYTYLFLCVNKTISTEFGSCIVIKWSHNLPVSKLLNAAVLIDY